MTCFHDWQPLYIKPSTKEFLQIWDASELGSWQQCNSCKQLGRIRANKLKLEPEKKRSACSSASLSRRLADAQKWNDSVRVYHQNVN